MSQQLQDRLINLGQKINTGYDFHQGEVSLLISDTRNQLRLRFGMIAPWETEELELAENYVRVNFLRASLLAIYTALVVSEYSDEEYWMGYGYTHKNVIKVPRKIEDLTAA